MTEITVKLAGATLNDVKGITDDLAAKMFANLGSHHIAIVDLKVCEHTDSVDDKDKVLLKVSHLEIATEGDVETHLRDLSKAIHAKRTPTQLTIDSNLDDVEPSAEEIVERGKALHAEFSGETDPDDKPAGGPKRGSRKASK